MRFGSDNTSGVHPAIVDAIAAEGARSDAAYGADASSDSLRLRLSEVFEHEVQVFPVVTGTAANALALATITPPYGSIACTSVAHVMADECGAVEHLSGGARLVPLAHDVGCMRPDALAAELERLRHGVHSMPLSSVTLTQQTELGTVYSLDALQTLTAIARDAELRVHLDGARLPNALGALDCAPADVTWRVGVDLVSLGATKDGAMGADVIVVFDPALAEELAYRQKRAGHLLSKQRLVAAQLLAWLEDDLWLSNAAHANERAAEVADALRSCGRSDVELLWDPSGNEVFARLPDDLVETLHAAGAEFYEFDVDGDRAWRFVTSWATDPAETATLRAHL